MATSTASPKNFLKNLGPGGTFSTLGNNGIFFPYDQPDIPAALNCVISIEENREVNITTNDGRLLYINCPSSF